MRLLKNEHTNVKALVIVPMSATNKRNFLLFLLLLFFTPVGLLNSQGIKNYAMQYKKYKNQAGINLTPPPPSQNSHAVRWHCTAESERRVAEIKS